MEGSASCPVSILVPGADVRRLRTLAGDAAGGETIVTEASPVDIAKVCAAMILGLQPSDRREAIRWITSFITKAGSRSVDVVPIPALMPSDATVEQIAQMWNGLMLMLLALGSASADTSVGTVIANASSMASGQPFASDPSAAERQNEVILAKAILEAHLLGDAEASKWFRDAGLADALSALAASRDHGSTDAAQYQQAADERAQAIYDCYAHQLPLGGDVMAGGAIADFFRDAWAGLKDATSKGIGNALSQLGTKIAGNGAAPAQGTEQEKPTKELDASDQAEAGNVTQSVAAGVEEAKQALKAAQDKLVAGNESIESYREELKKTALQSARLQWAKALLEAPDDVATILSATSPNMADPGSFLHSMLATLPAAKETGNIGVLKSLLYALRSAIASGDTQASSLYSLISGDPQLMSDVQLNDQHDSPCRTAYRHQQSLLKESRSKGGAKPRRKQKGGE